MLSEGGILMEPNLELKVKVKPAELPESIDVDISSLKIWGIPNVADFEITTSVEIIIVEDDYMYSNTL